MNKGRELRSFDSIGYYNNNSHKHKVNKAYQTWASLYLNYDDDNLDHFFTRDMDVYPLKEQGVDPTNGVMVNSHMMHLFSRALNLLLKSFITELASSICSNTILSSKKMRTNFASKLLNLQRECL